MALKTSSGQTISQQDPNYAEYLKAGAKPEQTLNTPDNFQTTSQKNEYGEIVNPTQEDITNFNNQFTTYTPNSTITANSLKSTPFINYNTPPAPNIYPVNTLNYDNLFAPTAPEQQASDIGKMLQDLNLSLTGESAYKSEQETAQGIPGLVKTQNDLVAQLTGLKNQSTSLSNAYNYTIPNQMQESAQGRGMTAGGLQPLTASELRKNQIQQGNIASQSLTISSMLEATKGNLATAQDMVNRAVEQKFGPIKATQKALTDNLAIILNSPEYSLADKKRAQIQLDAQKQKDKEIAKQESDAKEIMTTATEAAKNGADALTLQKIQNATSPMEALQIAGPYMAVETQMKQKELENKIQQQAFDNNVSLENLKLDRAKFASDSEYKQAQLKLDEMKASLEIAKFNAPSKADIVKINGKDYQLNADGTYSVPDVPEETKQATETQNQAATSAQQLLDKLNSGKSFAFGLTSKLPILPGSAAADFNVQFNNLKSLLSLDNVKLLKGQGQVSDAERRLLADASARLDRSQSKDEFKKSLQDITVILGPPGQKQEKSDGTYIYKNIDGTVHKGKTNDNYIDMTKPPAPNFSMVGGDTNTAITQEVAQIPDGTKGGQCGRFINQLTGLGVGDSYKSKLSKMDKSIKKPEPGMVFTMPYRDTGHVGLIVGIDGDKAIVKDSNYSLDGKVKTHTIPINKMTGFARV